MQRVVRQSLGGYLTNSERYALEEAVAAVESGSVLNLSSDLAKVTARALKNNGNFLTGFKKYLDERTNETDVQDDFIAHVNFFSVVMAEEIGRNFETMVDDKAPEYMRSKATVAVAAEVLLLVAEEARLVKYAKGTKPDGKGSLAEDAGGHVSGKGGADKLIADSDFGALNQKVKVVSSRFDTATRVTPESLGINAISENQKLVSMWTDSLKYLNTAQTKAGHKYRTYLDAMSSGSVSKDVARSAYEEVAVQFRRRLKAAQNDGETFEGFNFERIHHWNWPIGDFPADATNANKLFPLPHDRHMDIHRAVTIGPHPTNSPIDPINIMEEPPQSLLPDNYLESN
ncbi:MAG: hypothetical protein OQL20_04195 [Sedimenticola sp.]|nr:hypothetical protein [Sedimenticola sp.]